MKAPKIMRDTGIASALYDMHFRNSFQDEMKLLFGFFPKGVVVQINSPYDIYLVCVKTLHSDNSVKNRLTGKCEIMSARGNPLPDDFFGIELQFVRWFDPCITDSNRLKDQLITDRGIVLARDYNNRALSRIQVRPKYPLVQTADTPKIEKTVGSQKGGRSNIFSFDPSEVPRPQNIKGAVMHSRSRFRLFCSHCTTTFWAKPTQRMKKFVVNHRCEGAKKRRQFVIGSYHRKCAYSHSAPCVYHLPDASIPQIS